MTRPRHRTLTWCAAMLLAAASCAPSSTDGASRIDGSEPVEATDSPRQSSIPADDRNQTEMHPSSSSSPPSPGASTDAPIRTGAERLVEDDFESIAGLRVGLIVNQTSLVAGEHLIDHVNDHPAVELTAIFAPEHGVRGLADAGAAVADTVDPRTGVTVFSLYGAARQPTAEMLGSVDVLVYDLQDVGARFYTYISTMGLAMREANQAGIRFVVLDRPNPLGGHTVDGFVREPSLDSFVGLYPVPAVYGLTAGELASAIVGEGWIDGVDGLDLEIIELEGWERSQRWHETGLDWIAPSPGLPSTDAALAYPGTVLFEATTLSYGKGTVQPFVTIGAPWVDGPAVAKLLNAEDLAGVRFDPIVFTPDPALAVDPRLSGQELAGVRFVLTDRDAFDPMAVGGHVLVAFQAHADERGLGSIVDRPGMFDLLAGSTEYRRLLEAGASADELIAAWQPDAEAFTGLRTPYLLY